MNAISNFVIPGILFFLTLSFGFWLARIGKPYNGILFNIHKLIALGAVIVTIVEIYKLLPNAETQFILIALLVIAGLCVVALFASGAMMSAGKLNYNVMLTTHKISPVLAVIAMGMMIYLLSN